MGCAGCTKIGSKFGRMAQLVEHIVHIDGVTGSSPVATTTRLASLLARFLLTLLPYLKGRESHGEIHLPRKAQQEGPKRTGQSEAYRLGLLPHNKEARKQKTLQPQEKRSRLEG